MNDESKIELYISTETGYEDISYYAPESYLKKVERENILNQSDDEGVPEGADSPFQRAEMNRQQRNLKYLNSNRDKEEMINLTNFERDELKDKELFHNISKEFVTPNDHNGQKEIQKISFSKDLKYDSAALINNTSDLRSFNFSDRLKEFNVFNKKNKEYIYTYPDIPMYDSDEKMKNRYSLVSDNKSSQGKTDVNISQPINTPIDMTYSYENDNSKFTARLERHRSNNVINNF